MDSAFVLPLLLTACLTLSDTWKAVGASWCLRVTLDYCCLYVTIAEGDLLCLISKLRFYSHIHRRKCPVRQSEPFSCSGFCAFTWFCLQTLRIPANSGPGMTSLLPFGSNSSFSYFAFVLRYTFPSLHFSGKDCAFFPATFTFSGVLADLQEKHDRLVQLLEILWQLFHISDVSCCWQQGKMHFASELITQFHFTEGCATYQWHLVSDLQTATSWIAQASPSLLLFSCWKCKRHLSGSGPIVHFFSGRFLTELS